VVDVVRTLVEERPRSLTERRAESPQRWRNRSAESWQWRGTPSCPYCGCRHAVSATEPDELIVRYLTAFGPASLADIQAWSGLRSTGPRGRSSSGRDSSYSRMSGDASGWIFPMCRARPPTLPPLPEYDNLLLAHADRSRVIPERLRKAHHHQPGSPDIDREWSSLPSLTDRPRRLGTASAQSIDMQVKTCIY
jgi:hypothetical protein